MNQWRLRNSDTCRCFRRLQVVQVQTALFPRTRSSVSEADSGGAATKDGCDPASLNESDRLLGQGQVKAPPY